MMSEKNRNSTSLFFVVEHMEDELFDWCILEYDHLISQIGKDSLIITNLPNLSSSSASSSKNKFPIDNKNYFTKSITDLNMIPKERICLLDSEAVQPLTPQDITNFDYILAGGILGDVDENDPDRTKELRIHGFPTRHLGKEQMTLDTAIITAYKILINQIPFDELSFIDRPSFNLSSQETLQMPFRYLSDSNHQPLIPLGMLDLWRSSDF